MYVWVVYDYTNPGLPVKVHAGFSEADAKWWTLHQLTPSHYRIYRYTCVNPVPVPFML